TGDSHQFKASSAALQIVPIPAAFDSRAPLKARLVQLLAAVGEGRFKWVVPGRTPSVVVALDGWFRRPLRPVSRYGGKLPRGMGLGLASIPLGRTGHLEEKERQEEEPQLKPFGFLHANPPGPALLVPLEEGQPAGRVAERFGGRVHAVEEREEEVIERRVLRVAEV